VRPVAGHGAGQGDLRLDRPVGPSGAQFRDHLLEHRLQRCAGVPVQHQTAAQAPARQVKHVVDQPAHAPGAFLHERDDRRRLLVQGRTAKQPGPRRDGRERVPQVVAERGEELLAQLRGLPLAEERRLAGRQPLLGVEAETEQVGEQPEHADRPGRPQLRRPGIDRAQRAEERVARAADRHRDVALEAVPRRGRVAAEGLVLGDVVDDDRLAAGLDLPAEGGRDLQLAAWVEPGPDPIAYRAGDPVVPGGPCDRGDIALHVVHAWAAHSCGSPRTAEHVTGARLRRRPSLSGKRRRLAS
jgi:hypothetical protein